MKYYCVQNMNERLILGEFEINIEDEEIGREFMIYKDGSLYLRDKQVVLYKDKDKAIETYAFELDKHIEDLQNELDKCEKYKLMCIVKCLPVIKAI